MALKNLVKQAPVTTLSAAESAVGFTLTELVTHHVIGTVNVSSLTQSLAPFVALLLPAVFGAAKWALVSPYDKVKAVLERDGVMSDADFGRLETIVESKLVELFGVEPAAAAPTEAFVPAAEHTDSPPTVVPTQTQPVVGA